MKRIIMSLIFIAVFSTVSHAYNSSLYKTAINAGIVASEQISSKPLLANISTARNNDRTATESYDELSKETKEFFAHNEKVVDELKKAAKANDGAINLEQSINSKTNNGDIAATYLASSRVISDVCDNVMKAVGDAKSVMKDLLKKLQSGKTAALKSQFEAVSNNLNEIQPIVSGLSNDVQKEIKNAKLKAEEEGTRKFAGISFGVGASLTIDIGNEDRVESATAVNGIVRVEKSKNSIPRVILESHYFFLPDWKFLGLVEKQYWGWGPFLALQPGSNDIIDAIGWGIMVGFRRNLESTVSWNFGCGMIVDPNAKILGNGIVADKPLPAGETQVRYEERSQWGVLLISSFSF